MGCGAVCGDNSTIYQPNQYSLQIFMKMIPNLKNAPQLIPQKQYNLFITQIKQNPNKYRLKLIDTLQQNQQIDVRILRKWKIILFCHDNKNSEYINCLGYKSDKITKKIKEPFQSQNKIQQNNYTYQFNQQDTLKLHNHFSTIRKDIDRTSNVPENKKAQFQNILKRITNHFPKMGYTQGMNFLIAFFLKMGYSQFETFWIFVHIAVNKRFLLLGFFQDNFPLQKNYQIIFKNLLRRQNKKLYVRIYEQLQFPQNQWLIKWFITFYHYSFPIQIVPYAFDILIDIGSIGLITFSLGIIQELSQLIYQQDKVQDLYIEFSNLKNIQFFNTHVNLKKAIDKAYKVKIKKQDFQGIENINQDHFYSNYILKRLQEDISNNKNITVQKTQLLIVQNKLNPLKQKNNEQNKINPHAQSDKILNIWYEQIVQQRKQFLNKTEITKKTERISIESHFDDLILSNQHRKNQYEQIIIEDVQQQNKNSVKDSTEMKNLTNPSTGYSYNKKSSRIKNDDMNSQIDQLWEQQDDTNSYVSKNISSKISQQSRSQQGFDNQKNKPKYQDQLDKLATTQNINNNKIRYNLYQKSSSIFDNQQISSLKPKINNFQSPGVSYKNTFMRTGSNILYEDNSKSKLAYDSSNSQSSKNYQYKQRKQKQNNIDILKSKSNIASINSKVNKIKTQGKKSITDDLSEHDSSIDPKNSIYASNQSIQQDIRNQQLQNQGYSMKVFDPKRQKLTTHHDIFINSLEASKIIQNHSKNFDSIESEIQIFQANHGFKKKNRVSSRINGPINSSGNQNLKRFKLNHNVSDVKINQKRQALPSERKKITTDLNYEQSCDSFYATSNEMDNKKSRDFKQSIQQYQIESVK